MKSLENRVFLRAEECSAFEKAMATGALDGPGDPPEVLRNRYGMFRWEGYDDLVSLMALRAGRGVRLVVRVNPYRLLPMIAMLRTLGAWIDAVDFKNGIAIGGVDDEHAPAIMAKSHLLLDRIAGCATDSTANDWKSSR